MATLALVLFELLQLQALHGSTRGAAERHRILVSRAHDALRDVSSVERLARDAHLEDAACALLCTRC